MNKNLYSSTRVNFIIANFVVQRARNSYYAYKLTRFSERNLSNDYDEVVKPVCSFINSIWAHRHRVESFQ